MALPKCLSQEYVDGDGQKSVIVPMRAGYHRSRTRWMPRWGRLK